MTTKLSIIHHIAHLAMNASLCKDFYWKLGNILLGRTVDICQIDICIPNFSWWWKIASALQKLWYLQSLQEVSILQKLPSASSFVMVWSDSQVIFFLASVLTKISGDLAMPNFWWCEHLTKPILLYIDISSHISFLFKLGHIYLF